MAGDRYPLFGPGSRGLGAARRAAARPASPGAAGTPQTPRPPLAAGVPAAPPGTGSGAGPGASSLRPRSLRVDRFAFGRSTLEGENKRKVTALAADLLVLSRRYPKRLRIHIHSEGHTDPVGSRVANVGLGLDRALAVNEHLESFLRPRIGQVYLMLVFGSSAADHPIASNSTPAGRSRNRRVEVRVTLELAPKPQPSPPTPTDETRGTKDRGRSPRGGGEPRVPEPRYPIFVQPSPGDALPRGPSILDVLRRARQAIRHYRRLRKTVSRIRRIVRFFRGVKDGVERLERELEALTDRLLRSAPAWVVLVPALFTLGPRAFSLEFDGSLYIQGPGGFRIGLDRIAKLVSPSFGLAVKSVEDKLAKLQEYAEALEEALGQVERGEDGGSGSSGDREDRSPTAILAWYGFKPSEAKFHPPVDERHKALAARLWKEKEPARMAERPHWRQAEATVHRFLQVLVPSPWETQVRFVAKARWRGGPKLLSTVPDHWNESLKIAVETKCYQLANPIGSFGYPGLVRTLSGRTPARGERRGGLLKTPVLQMAQRQEAVPDGTHHWLALDLRRQGKLNVKSISRKLRQDLRTNRAFIFEELIVVVNEGFLTLRW